MASVRSGVASDAYVVRLRLRVKSSSAASAHSSTAEELRRGTAMGQLATRLGLSSFVGALPARTSKRPFCCVTPPQSACVQHHT